MICRLQLFLIQSFWVVFVFVFLFCSNIIFPKYKEGIRGGGYSKWLQVFILKTGFTFTQFQFVFTVFPGQSFFGHSVLLNVKHTLGRTTNWAWQFLLSVPQSHWLGAWWRPRSALLEYDLLQSSFSTDSKSAFRRGVKEKDSSDKGNMQCLFSTFLKLFDEFIPYKQRRWLG